MSVMNPNSWICLKRTSFDDRGRKQSGADQPARSNATEQASPSGAPLYWCARSNRPADSLSMGEDHPST
jgi:hypothetical protein